MLTLYKLKVAVQRTSALLGAAGLLAGVVASAVPAAVFADALNPLTERSLTLSSSSPGWSYLDGSGNPTYAYPNSGANGQKTGNTFQFRMSSVNKTIKAITFQYCTTPAGDCVAPGDNGHGVAAGTATFTSGSATVSGDVSSTFGTDVKAGATIVTAGNNTYTVASIGSANSLTLTANATANESGVTFGYSNPDTATTTDLNVAMPSETLISNTGSPSDWSKISGGTDSAPAYTPNADGTEGEFVVLTRDYSSLGAGVPATYTTATDWAAASSNSETGSIGAGTATGKNNLITLSSATGILMDTQDYFKIIFYGTTANYITNPGSGAFFVRINTYSAFTAGPPVTVSSTDLVDGGVTVANVMNESISITTKVLETMAFSVGTYDPDKYTNAVLTAKSIPAHGQCSTLLMADPTSGTYSTDPHNLIRLGNASNEYSLETGVAYDGFSYWRLSSNSSGGATVYYTGHTLTNTEGDEIMPLTEASGGTSSITGTEQFGLGIATDSDNTLLGGSTQTYPVWENDSPLYNSYGDLDASTPTDDGDFATFLYDAYTAASTTLAGNDAYAHYPRLYPLVPQDPYGDQDDNGSGSAAGTITSGGTAKFAFDSHADTYARPIATESTDVVNCVTAKMRYVANIAATTPAGVYTTKINYVASPQY